MSEENNDPIDQLVEKIVDIFVELEPEDSTTLLALTCVVASALYKGSRGNLAHATKGVKLLSKCIKENLVELDNHLGGDK